MYCSWIALDRLLQGDDNKNDIFSFVLKIIYVNKDSPRNPLLAPVCSYSCTMYVQYMCVQVWAMYGRSPGYRREPFSSYSCTCVYRCGLCTAGALATGGNHQGQYSLRDRLPAHLVLQGKKTNTTTVS